MNLGGSGQNLGRVFHVAGVRFVDWGSRVHATLIPNLGGALATRCIYIYIYICKHIFMCIYVQTFIYMYIHRHSRWGGERQLTSRVSNASGVGAVVLSIWGWGFGFESWVLGFGVECVRRWGRGSVCTA